jgi:hypothetical protein
MPIPPVICHCVSSEDYALLENRPGGHSAARGCEDCP